MRRWRDRDETDEKDLKPLHYHSQSFASKSLANGRVAARSFGAGGGRRKAFAQCARALRRGRSNRPSAEGRTSSRYGQWSRASSSADVFMSGYFPADGVWSAHQSPLPTGNFHREPRERRENGIGGMVTENEESAVKRNSLFVFSAFSVAIQNSPFAWFAVFRASAPPEGCQPPAPFRGGIFVEPRTKKFLSSVGAASGRE